MFIFITGLAAFAVALCAAFFSVQGIATLYTGQYWSVVLMASGLEVGKLVAASYLHRYWSKTSIFLKFYLTLAVVVLMAITSLGVFGFLTSAYQTNFAKVELVDTKQQSLNDRKVFIETEIKQLNERISTLNAARASQEKRLPSMSTTSAKPIYEDIARSGEEIQQIRSKINEMSAELLKAKEEVVVLETDKHKHSDIGTLKFVASIFNLTIEEVVKWFTLALVFVFDPLAVSLVLAYNNALLSRIKANDILPKKEEETIENNPTQNILNASIKYRDNK